MSDKLVMFVICPVKGHSVMVWVGVILGYTDEPQNIDGAPNRALSLKQAFETALHVLCDWETLATLRFRHMGHHLMKSGDC